MSLGRNRSRGFQRQPSAISFRRLSARVECTVNSGMDLKSEKSEAKEKA